MLKIYNYKEKLDKHLSYKADENIRHVSLKYIGNGADLRVQITFIVINTST